MAVGDVYEVVDVQEMYDQEVLNVYFYQQRGAFVPLEGTIAQALADEWNETILPLMLGIQNEDLTHIETRVRNLFDPTDQGVSISGVPGSAAGGGDGAPSFNAYGFRFNIDNAAVRPGSKRLAGVSEGAVVDGVVTGGTITAANTLGDALAAPITGGLIITEDIMFPVVVQRVRSGSPGAYTYRLPENDGELVLGTIIETLFKVIVTSQISRKIGIGV